MFNLHGVSGSKSSFDTELGADIMLLEQHARMYGGNINQQNDLIDLAWDMVRNHSELAVRLRAALQSVFANSLHGLVCELGSLKRTLYTVVRIAKTDESFNKVNIRLGQPPHPTSNIKAIVPKLTKQSNPASSAQNSPIMTPPTSPLRSKVDVWEIIKPYLAKEDQERGLHQLSSVAKQDTAILVAFVVRGLVPPPATMAYFKFGFVTCLDKKQECDLMQCYQRVLKAVALPNTAFNELVKALELSTLYGLLRNKNDPEIQTRLIALHKFLTVRPEQLWSVFRLIHFIRDSDNDEPLPCLKRDFGFKLCKQREEVTKLKALYARVIQKAGPKALHSACAFGRLFHFVNATLGLVEPPMRRFLQNDYPSPAVGFDNSQGLELYLAPLFKKSLSG